jgi:type II secretory pathway component GspD/PulD (secretin)
MQNTVNQYFKPKRQKILSVVIAYLAVGSSMIFAGSVDDRTLPIWTNYLNSKFSIDGPSQEEWSRKRGNTSDDLIEEDLRISYQKAVDSGDLARQEALVADLQARKPEDLQYRQWKLDVEGRFRAAASKKMGKSGTREAGGMDMKIGRLGVMGSQDLYLWEASSLPVEMQEPILEKVQRLKKERVSWAGVKVEATAMPKTAKLRRVRVDPVTLEQAGELGKILKALGPEAPAPDLLLLTEKNRATRDADGSLGRLARAGKGQGTAGTESEASYSFTARDMPLKDALAMFGKLNGLNILPDPNADGLLTVTFRGLSLEKAMDAMLLNFGYYAEEEGGLIRVRAMETRRFIIDYPRAIRTGSTSTSGSVSLPSVSSGGGGGGSSGGGGGGGGGQSGDSSTISITTDDSIDMWKMIVEHVRTLLSEADASQASSLGGATSLAKTASVDTTTAGAVNTTMIDFQQAQSYMDQFKKGPRLFADSVSGVIEVRDKHDNIREIAAYIEDLRLSLNRQVDLNVKIYSVEFTDGRELAIDWNKVAIVAGNTLITGSAVLAPATLPAAVTALVATPMQITIANSKVDAVINAIEEQGKLKLLTQPRIRTLNHQPAVIKIQRTIPTFVSQSNLLQSQSGNAQGNNVQVNNVTVGTLLSITPTISKNRTVALDIIPVVSRLIAIRNYNQTNSVTDTNGNVTGQVVNGNLASAPEVDIRQCATLVKVNDQETIVMGGLIEDETVDTRKKIPFLGDIPGLGVLFTSMVQAKILKELVFFVSPTVVDNVPLAEATK